MTTWEDRIYDDSLTPDERGELWEEFVEEMGEEVRELLAESDFDYEFRINESKPRVMISTEKGFDGESAKEVRDYLAGHEIGDESVTVTIEPTGEDGEPRDNVPPIWNGHRVSVMLHEYLAEKRVTEQEVKETLNEAANEMIEGGE